MAEYAPSRYIVISQAPITREAAGLAVFATFRVLTEDFEVWIEDDAPVGMVYVADRQALLPNPLLQ